MDQFLDTSWSLHYTSTNSTSYRHLFDQSTTQDRLSRYFDRLPRFLSSQKPQYTDDLNNESEKLGSFRECKYTISTLPSYTSVQQQEDDVEEETKRTIHLQLLYQHATFTFNLCTPYLILSKASTSHTKHVINFLSETFSISIDPLKLPSSFLCESLQKYITALTAPFTSSENDDALNSEKRAAMLRAAIGTLKLTVSFSGTVAPHLKTLDLSVPYETVDVLISESASQSGGAGFMQSLADHLHLQTGLKLPLATGTDAVEENHVDASSRAGSTASEPLASTLPLRLSKMTSAAFAVSIEGKLRFAVKAIENAIDQEELVTASDVQLITDIIDHARRKGTLR